MSEVKEYPLVYHFGDSFDGITWQWKGSDGNAKDITGYLASLKVRNEDGDVVLHLDSDAQGGLSIPVGTDGKVVLSASPTVMASGALVDEAVTHEYDIQVKSSDGSIVKTLTKGPFRIDKQVTDV